MAIQLPDPGKVVDLLRSLLGCDVPFHSAAKSDPLASGFGCVCYGDDNKPVAAFTVNPHAGAFLGGRLMMMPTGPLEDAAKTGQLDEILVEALTEVFNNLTVPLNAIEGNPHMRSTPAMPLEQMMAQEAANWMAKGKRLGFEGSVLGGTGHFEVVVPA